MMSTVPLTRTPLPAEIRTVTVPPSATVVSDTVILGSGVLVTAGEGVHGLTPSGFSLRTCAS